MTRDGDSGYIGPSLVVRGRLSGEGMLRVDGQLVGEVSTRGRVVVGARGLMLAAVSTTTLDVEGQVRGDVVASESVAIRRGGRIDGDVRAKEVAIDDGGALHGSIAMDFDVPGDLFATEEER